MNEEEKNNEKLWILWITLCISLKSDLFRHRSAEITLSKDFFFIFQFFFHQNNELELFVKMEIISICECLWKTFLNKKFTSQMIYNVRHIWKILTLGCWYTMNWKKTHQVKTLNHFELMWKWSSRQGWHNTDVRVNLLWCSNHWNRFEHTWIYYIEKSPVFWMEYVAHSTSTSLTKSRIQHENNAKS